jgi:hypothetical protein
MAWLSFYGITRHVILEFFLMSYMGIRTLKAQVWFWKLSDTKVANVMWSSVIKLGISNM